MTDHQPIDLRRRHDLAWNNELRPWGEGEAFDKEPFAAWWSRVGAASLMNLHPLIAEQWIHRHWSNSPFCNLPIERLSWSLERWSTARLIAKVARSDPADPINLAHDYDLCGNPKRTSEPSATMRVRGTWNLPIIVIATPNGAHTATGLDVTGRYHLIEGHQRMRCLAAFREHGATLADEHEVFVVAPTE